nr:PREDICTED: probable ATP-dependent RNA helicase DHX34 [Latimeria chalumnae]|eukprot:XP_014343896.1 PREDICTED: probable ATP-dependent RNA helicase DHX34 [Latimeria chalumnae]
MMTSRSLPLPTGSCAGYCRAVSCSETANGLKIIFLMFLCSAGSGLQENERDYSVSQKAFLLLSRSLDTNADCTRVVVDAWVEIAFRHSDAALRVLSSAVQLRASWEQVLNSQLEAHHRRREDTAHGPNSRAVTSLTRRLVEFMRVEVIVAEL